MRTMEEERKGKRKGRERKMKRRKVKGREWKRKKAIDEKKE